MAINLITIKGERALYFINKPGLYHLIFRSTKSQSVRQLGL
ncbi:MAG: hypothetical protein NTY50_09880 [Methylobacter sp.]|nr:hypothetical protein [Methylobacter sp.]